MNTGNLKCNWQYTAPCGYNTMGCGCINTNFLQVEWGWNVWKVFESIWNRIHEPNSFPHFPNSQLVPFHSILYTITTKYIIIFICPLSLALSLSSYSGVYSWAICTQSLWLNFNDALDKIVKTVCRKRHLDAGKGKEKILSAFSL